MINGFEKQTQELTEYESDILLPLVVKQLKLKLGEKQSVTNAHVCRAFKNHGYKMTAPRFRKIINHIRINGLINHLVSSSKGYFVATSESEIERYIESLDQRINSITTVRDSLFHQLKNNEIPRNYESRFKK